GGVSADDDSRLARVALTWLAEPGTRAVHRLVELRGRLDCGSLSARGFDRVIRMAWTIADLDGRDRPDREDVREATQLRTGEAA
ncbi:magnesium chelatase subunit ChlI family protein, partial [Micromonospora tarensis]